MISYQKYFLFMREGLLALKCLLYSTKFVYKLLVIPVKIHESDYSAVTQELCPNTPRSACSLVIKVSG